MRRLRNHSEAMCDLCAVYGQDFACLGYAFPPACRREECMRKLSAAHRRAIRTQESERAHY